MQVAVVYDHLINGQHHLATHLNVLGFKPKGKNKCADTVAIKSRDGHA